MATIPTRIVRTIDPPPALLLLATVDEDVSRRLEAIAEKG
jgi:hypothetical protein